MRLPRIRRQGARIEDIAIPADERLVAVGSLAGMLPADVDGYVLVAISGDDISISGGQCCHASMLLLASAIREIAAEVAALPHGSHS
jgi:hypothetical protein